jgi:hypothetical protein
VPHDRHAWSDPEHHAWVCRGHVGTVGDFNILRQAHEADMAAAAAAMPLMAIDEPTEPHRTVG